MAQVLSIRNTEFDEPGKLFVTFLRHNGARAGMFINVESKENGVIFGRVEAGCANAIDLHSVGNRVEIRGAHPNQFISSDD